MLGVLMYNITPDSKNVIILFPNWKYWLVRLFTDVFSRFLVLLALQKAAGHKRQHSGHPEQPVLTVVSSFIFAVRGEMVHAHESDQMIRLSWSQWWSFRAITGTDREIYSSSDNLMLHCNSFLFFLTDENLWQKQGWLFGFERLGQVSSRVFFYLCIYLMNSICMIISVQH